MRNLPFQALHCPFADEPYRMAMNLVTVAEGAWFEIDERYPEEMAEKRHLLATRHAEVFAATANTAAAREEALAVVAAALVAHHPDWFARKGSVLHNRLTGEMWRLGDAGDDLGDDAGDDRGDDPGTDPLEIAGRLVQEDLCLIEDRPEGPVFTAAVLCFPSRWSLAEKIGRPLADVHAVVPFYAERLSRPVDRFMRHLKPGAIACRLNWSLPDDPALFQPGGKWRQAIRPDITPDNAGERIFLRVERQTLRRLPRSGAVLFGIRVHVYPLSAVSGRAADLAAAVRALPAEITHYKSVLPFRDAVLAWADSRGALSDC